MVNKENHSDGSNKYICSFSKFRVQAWFYASDDASRCTELCYLFVGDTIEEEGGFASASSPGYALCGKTFGQPRFCFQVGR
jgi:hypothetical protein